MKQLFGWMLMAVGGLIAGLSGLCTLVLGFNVLPEVLRHPSNAVGFVFLGALFGGIPIAVGIGLFAAGRALARSGKPGDV